MGKNDNLRYLNAEIQTNIRNYKQAGYLDKANELIDIKLQEKDLPEAMKARLLCEKEIMRRIPDEFPFNKEQALAHMREKVADFTEEEFEEGMRNEDIHWTWINGEQRFFKLFRDSMLGTKYALRARSVDFQGTGLNPEEVVSKRRETTAAILKKMKTEGKMELRFRVRHHLKLKDEQFTPGMFVRVHIPLPLECSQQYDIRIEAMSPEGGKVAPGDAPMRTICWEENMAENHDFWVEYSYTHREVYNEVYGKTGEPSTDYLEFTEQKHPQIVFTPYIRGIVDEICAGVSDPLEKARRIYDFITKRMHYTYVPPYILNYKIPETCARNYAGDCGIFALTFITMCRYAGIPAQWQSGLCGMGEGLGNHDWARFYVKPYGWLLADCSFGVASTRDNYEERRQFYFGNLDPYRMIANWDFQADFTIPKEEWSSDPYDNQSGEIETTGKGFRFGYEYENNVEVLCCEEV